MNLKYYVYLLLCYYFPLLPAFVLNFYFVHLMTIVTELVLTIKCVLLCYYLIWCFFLFCICQPVTCVYNEIRMGPFVDVRISPGRQLLLMSTNNGTKCGI